ncbi:DUF3618 domain-containing protein [Micromonospora sp. CA-244673]|uniref:DUF3618 domain-containing protein n=1 Tax=Micromonospora sp. CA-244673 TaxID=3239958 RepID=UPI003D8D9106
MSAASPSDPDKVRQDIQQTRAELGETVAALAAKTDVKARLGGKATSAAGVLRQRLTTASQSAKTSATQRFRTVSQKASQRAAAAKQKAGQAVAKARGSASAGAQTTGKTESTEVTSARAMRAKMGTAVRTTPVPVLAAAGAAAALTIVAYRRHRTR